MVEKSAFDASTQRCARNRTGEDNAYAHMKRQVMSRVSCRRYYEWQIGFRPLGANLLRRVRRSRGQKGAGKGHRRIAVTMDDTTFNVWSAKLK